MVYAGDSLIPRGGAAPWGRRLLREPLLHFLVLGGALFLWNRFTEPHAEGLGAGQTPSMRITVTRDQVARMADGYRRQYGAAPSAPDLAALVDQYVTEEMFYREAIRLGLDRDDEIVRRRLVQKMQFLDQDLAPVPPPTEAQLQRFQEHHADRYRLPERITFTHVYFSPDRRGESGARVAAERFAAAANRAGVVRAPERGDRFPGPSDLSSLVPDDLVRVFGRDGLSQQIHSLPLHTWSQPLRSGYGWHSVYVSQQLPGRPALLSEVRDTVLADYEDAEREQRNAASLQALRRQFEVVRE